MGHNKKFGGYMAAVTAVTPVFTAATGEALVGSSINATGFDRATFIFTLGGITGTGYMSSGIGIWNAATSGAAYSQINGASFGQIGSTAASSANYVIDMDVNPSYPWLRVSGIITSSSWYIGCACVLRTPNAAPPTSLSGQIVTL
jgi:hypothetical protein